MYAHFTLHIPALVIHDGADKTVPVEASSDRTAAMLPDCEYKVYDFAPHGLFYTGKEMLKRDPVHFYAGKRDGGPVSGDRCKQEIRIGSNNVCS